MLKKSALCLALAATSSMAALEVQAQAITDIKAKTPHSAYVQDARGVVARNPWGLCWRTGYWTPADALPGCDAPLAPKEEPAPPPVAAVAPAPAPPAPPPPPKRCDFSATFTNDQTFAFNKAVLSAQAKARIDSEVMPKLSTCAKVEVLIITGHADKIGSQQYNQKLSEKRADAVAAYLKSKGVTATIETLGMGKTQPIKACDDKLKRKDLIECLTPNRRVVVEGRGLAN